MITLSFTGCRCSTDVEQACRYSVRRICPLTFQVPLTTILQSIASTGRTFHRSSLTWCFIHNPLNVLVSTTTRCVYGYSETLCVHRYYTYSCEYVFVYGVCNHYNNFCDIFSRIPVKSTLLRCSPCLIQWLRRSITRALLMS